MFSTGELEILLFWSPRETVAMIHKPFMGSCRYEDKPTQAAIENTIPRR